MKDKQEHLLEEKNAYKRNENKLEKTILSKKVDMKAKTRPIVALERIEIILKM